MKTYQHFINGDFVNPRNNEWFDTENPYTGEVWAKIPKGNGDDINSAVLAAKTAFEGVWGEMNQTTRGKLLVKFAELIERDAQKLGELEVKSPSARFGRRAGPVRDRWV